MAKLIMLIGPPGSGKSYLANGKNNPNSLEKQGYKIFSSDAMRLKINNDINDQSSAELVFNKLHGLMFNALNKNQDVVFDACNTKKKDRKNFFRSLKKYVKNKNVEVIGVIFDTSIEECKKRNLNKDRDHSVPDEVIDRSFYRLTGGYPSLEEGFDRLVSSSEFIKEMNGLDSVIDSFKDIKDNTYSDIEKETTISVKEL